MDDLKNVESIRPKRELIGWLSLPDLIFVGLITGISYLVRGLAHPVFEIPFVLFTGLNAVLLVKPPKENPKQKNYTMLWLILRRYFFKEYTCYRSIDIREFSEK